MNESQWSFVVTDISILTFCKLWLFICFDKHDQKLNCAKINCGLMEDTRSPEHKHNLPHLFLLVWNTHHHRHIAKEITKGTHTHNEQQTMIWVFLVFFLWTSWFQFLKCPVLICGFHLFWIAQWKQTLEEAPHGRHKGPCVGGYEMWIISCSPGFQPLCAPFSFHVLLGLCCNFMTDS